MPTLSSISSQPRFSRVLLPYSSLMASSTKERETMNGHGPLKTWRVFSFPTSILKKSEVLSARTSKFPMTTIIAISVALIVSLSAFLYITYSDQFSYPDCCDDKLFISFASQKFSQVSVVVPNAGNEKTNLSHIFFGIGGSAKTWNDRRRYSELWWKPNVSRGYVWLDEGPNILWPTTSPPFRISEDTTRFKYSCWYGSRSAIRIARIVKESFELGLENVRWFVMGDDDTIFFTENLLTVLNKFDHNQMYYIGGNSESVEQDIVHSYNMAYGGGGFAISYPLAAELVRVLDGCIDRYESLYGSDQKIQGCMSEIGVPVTKELGFHQVDIRGDPYGLLAAHPVAPLVSLHHLDYVEPIFPELTQHESTVRLFNAYQKDPSRTLQQSICHDLTRNWSVSVSWGYTVQLYPKLVDAKTLGTALGTFQSWKSWATEPFTLDTREVSLDPCDGPIVYFLKRVQRDDKGQTLSVYKSFKAQNQEQCPGGDYRSAFAVKYVNVSAPIFDPQLWLKAPRRQCCEIMEGVNGRNSVMQVEIRGCNPWESVSPPDVHA